MKISVRARVAVVFACAWLACASPRDVAVDNRDAAADGAGRAGSGGSSAGTGGMGGAATNTADARDAENADLASADVGPDALAPLDLATGDSRTCEPNETRCVGTTLEICADGGSWTKKMECPGVCQAGACSGVCRPDSKRCGTDQIPETCTPAGQWAPGNKCTYACTGAGICSGQCVPGSKRCGGANSLQPELCDDTGSWKPNGAVCPNVCSSGTCGGSCSPTTKRCGANQTPETCSAQGTWEPGAACPYVCSGAGACTGSCKPMARDCSGKVPRRCDNNGAWVSETMCTVACVGAGVCTVCEPGITRKCNGGTLQVCKPDGSGFQDEKTCAAGCNMTRAECNTCVPNRARCDGSTSFVCNASGTAEVRTDCANACGHGMCSGQCVAIKELYCIPSDVEVPKPADTHCNLHAAQETSFECKAALTGSCQFGGGNSIFIYKTTDRVTWTPGPNRYICAGQVVPQWREIPIE
ncbi:MAG TPA: hypothetical protein VGG33_26910 [Polyangia bacterium]